MLETSTISVGISNFRKNEKQNRYLIINLLSFSVTSILCHNSRKATNKTQYFDTLLVLKFSPYVPIQVIPVGVERSNGAPTGTYRLAEMLHDVVEHILLF